MTVPESHYIVVKLTEYKGLIVGLLKRNESSDVALTIPRLQKTMASRAQDFTVQISADRIEWIDGSAEVRALAHATGLPVLNARESQWLAYGQAYVKDRGAQGGRKTKGQLTDAKLKAARKNWAKVWPKKSLK